MSTKSSVCVLSTTLALDVKQVKLSTLYIVLILCLDTFICIVSAIFVLRCSYVELYFGLTLSHAFWALSLHLVQGLVTHAHNIT